MSFFPDRTESPQAGLAASLFPSPNPARPRHPAGPPRPTPAPHRWPHAATGPGRHSSDTQARGTQTVCTVPPGPQYLASEASGLGLTSVGPRSPGATRRAYLEDGGSGRKEGGGAAARVLQGPEGCPRRCQKETPAESVSSGIRESSPRIRRACQDIFLSYEKATIDQHELILGTCQTAWKGAFQGVKHTPPPRAPAAALRQKPRQKRPGEWFLRGSGSSASDSVVLNLLAV